MLSIKTWIKSVEILAVEFILQNTQPLTEALEVGDLPGTQELQRLPHIRVIYQAQEVFIGGACLLLWYDYKCTTDPENP